MPVSTSRLAERSLAAAVEEARSEGWALQDSGHTWAHLARREPVRHAALARLSGRTLGLGLLVWAAAAAAGPQWRRLVLGLDGRGRVVRTSLDAQGRVLP